MAMARQLFYLSTFLCAGGKIGSVRDYASSGERRGGEESSREHTPPDTRLGKGTSALDTR